MTTRTYRLRLTIESPTVDVPYDVVEKVVDYSTARDAIFDGVWAWAAGSADDEADLPDDFLDLSLSIDEPYRHIHEDCVFCGEPS